MPDDNDKEEKEGASIVSLDEVRQQRQLEHKETRARIMMFVEGLGLMLQATLGPVVRELAREALASGLPANVAPSGPKAWCLREDGVSTWCALARKPSRQRTGKFFRTLCGRDVPSTSVGAVVRHAPSCERCAAVLAERASKKPRRPRRR